MKEVKKKRSFGSIDRTRLDEHWIEQIDFMDEYAPKVARARRRLADLKAELEVVKAQVELDIRERPTHYKITGPVREGAIKARIPLHPKYRRILKRVNHAKYLVDLYEGTINVLEHRKKSLENLVVLHGRDYFVTSSKVIPKEVSERLTKKAFDRRKKRVDR